MDIHKMRSEMMLGRSVYDFPLRVTFYARVSTDKQEQASSLENQIQYYTELIQRSAHWSFVSGYIDEGLSGTSTKKRDSFNQMIADAHAGCFDFILTKEISRFSRSTLDSIRYTQELLEHHVGVLFQNDNINTLDTDSEFRLVVMAGVAQDEVRKLSERLKFGFRQSIKNGRVLGNDMLWGYDKQDCKLTVNDREAEAVRLIFALYGNEQLGIRRISRALFDHGFTSRNGNLFNSATIRHIITNPKYKGWYCGNKTRATDYRKKKSIPLAEEEWVCYPDPGIPALVSEELWEKSNALLKSRGQLMRQSGVEFHNRYPYSGKILCEEHQASFHRQILHNSGGDCEVWQCRVYRQQGRAACQAPQLRTEELNAILSEIFPEVCPNPDKITADILSLINNVRTLKGSAPELGRLTRALAHIPSQKDALLDLSMDGTITRAEFKARNDGLSEQLIRLQARHALLVREQAEEQSHTYLDNIRAALTQALHLENGISTPLAASMLEQVIVKKGTNPKQVQLELHLTTGARYAAEFERPGLSFRISSF